MAMLPGIGHAQSCGNDSIYKIPYKDTYVKQALVAEIWDRQPLVFRHALCLRL